MPINPVSEIKIDVSVYAPSGHAFLNSITAAMKPLVDDLNQAIDVYNAPENVEKKAEHLVQVEAKIKALDDAQNNKSLSYCPEYFEKIQDKLFREVQAEHRRLDAEAGIQLTNTPVTLTALIAQMDPDEVNELTDMLVHEQDGNLTQHLRAWCQTGGAGKQAFSNFLDTHTIRNLGGGNSKNFKVTHKRTRESQVLKVENRMGRAKKAEARLREGVIAGVFTSVFADRRAIYKDKKTGKKCSRSLQVVEFCPGSDVEKYGAALEDDVLKTMSAASVFIRMIEILEGMQASDCFFPDMKSTNWLIDSKGQVRIADGKSLESTDSSGNIEATRDLIITPYVSAPEMFQSTNTPLSADKEQVYMLAKNLYQHLSGCSYDAFYGVDALGRDRLILDASELDFDLPVFKTDKGLQYRQLIEDGMKRVPGDRPSLAEVAARIKVIDPEYVMAEVRQKELLKSKITAQIHVFETLAIGPADAKIEAFVDEKTATLQQDISVYDLAQMEKELQSKQEHLDIISVAVQEEVIRLKGKNMDSEVNLLEHMMSTLSLDERINTLQGDTPAAENLLEVLNFIAEAEKIKTPNDSNVSDLLNFMRKQSSVKLEEKRFEVAQEKFSDILKKIQGFQINRHDSKMDKFINQVFTLLKSNWNAQYLEGVNVDLEDTLNDIKIYTEQVKAELKVLKANGMTALVETFKQDVLNTPIEHRTASAAIQLIEQYREEVKEQQARDATKALEAEKESIYQVMDKMELLAVKAGDPIMQTFFSDIKRALQEDMSLSLLQATQKNAMNLLTQIEETSSNINHKIRQLLVADDSQLQGYAKVLSEAMAAVPINDRGKQLLDGHTPETQAVVDILTLIDEKEKQIQAQQEQTQAAYETTVSNAAETAMLKDAQVVFDQLMLDIEALVLPGSDLLMRELIEDIRDDLGVNPSLDELEEAKEALSDLLSEIQEVMKAFNVEINELMASDDELLHQLARELTDVVTATPINERGDSLTQNPEVMRIRGLIQEKRQEKAVHTTQDFKGTVSDVREKMKLDNTTDEDESPKIN
ncbi:MAG: hypothetical protein P1U61_03365 [Legionellaceae bacterium]|nr:hypothetical protein [Legionellaceae bacterium]